MTTFERVRQIISDQMEIDGEEIAANTVLRAAIGADDLDVIELVIEVAEAFDVEITDAEEESIFVVDDLVKIVDSRLKDKK
jgi:acyl carrier protein